jgi:hypothetical protein
MENLATWENCNFQWQNVDQFWNDVKLLIEVNRLIGGGQAYNSSAYQDYVRGNPWTQRRKDEDLIIETTKNINPYEHLWQHLKKDIGEEKTKRVIKLYCNYKGIEYNNSIEVNENINVSASDFESFVKNSIREGIKIKNL